MTYDHVADEKLRTILEQESHDEDSICYALTKTSEALEADKSNESVPFKIWDARNEAYENARHQWNEEGNAVAAIDALQICWTI